MGWRLLASLRVICIPGLNESASKVQRVLRSESLRKVFAIWLVQGWLEWCRSIGPEKTSPCADSGGVLLVVIGA